VHIFRSDLSAVRVAASNDETRYNLNSVRVETDGTLVATDGHRMHTVEPAATRNCDDAAPAEAFSIELASADAMLKRLPRKSKKAPEPRGAELDIDETNANGHAKFAMPDGDSLTAPKVTGYGDYPDWRQVIPKEEPTVTVRLNAVYLEQLAKAAREHCAGDENVSLELSLFDELSPIRATSENSRGDVLRVVLMPMRR